MTCQRSSSLSNRGSGANPFVVECVNSWEEPCRISDQESEKQGEFAFKLKSCQIERILGFGRQPALQKVMHTGLTNYIYKLKILDGSQVYDKPGTLRLYPPMSAGCHLQHMGR